MPKSVLAVLTLSLGVIATAAQMQGQSPSQPLPVRGWDVVRALNAGASLDIKLVHGHQSCSFRSADDASLRCHGATDVTLQRADIRKITQHHRGRSTLTGLGIGVGGGALAGAASTPTCSNFCIVGGKGFGATVGGVFGGLVGTVVGAATDFTRTTVYKAP